MDSDKLIRKLNSVGKEAFVRHYYLFRDYAENRISRGFAIHKLVMEGRSNEAGASMRLGNAKILFQEEASHQALLLIQQSRVSDEVKTLARAIQSAEFE